MKRLPSSFVFLAAAVLLTGNLSTARAENVPAPEILAARELEGTEWSLTTLNDKPAVGGERGTATLRLDAGKKSANGFSGVNRYFGSYERDGDKLKFGALAGTKMAGPPEANAAETAFLAALAATSKWRIEAGTLELLHDGKVLAKFTPAGKKEKKPE